MGSGKYPSLWRRPRTGPSSKNDCSSSSSSSSCSCTISFDFAFEVETQVTIFGESAGGWSVSHQLVRSSFLIRPGVYILPFIPIFILIKEMPFLADFIKKTGSIL